MTAAYADPCLVLSLTMILARTIGTGLRREGMAVDVVLDGNDALDHLAVTRYDVVVLDRDLPGVHGDEVCRRIVAGSSQSRVLMLTAASTVRERVDGLGLGATTTCPSHSTSPSSWPASVPWRGAPQPRCPRSSKAAT